MVMSPAGHGTKNDCGGNDQQQFTQQSVENCMTSIDVRQSMVMSPMELRTKNNCAGKSQQQFTQS
jgi:hypothetical protein